MACDGILDKEMLYNSGVLVEHCDGAVLPPADLWQRKRGGYVVIECPQRIPCNPCVTICPFGAVVHHDDINDTPEIDYNKCTGCGLCVARCPGLACFVIDITYSQSSAVIKLPYELLPLPVKGQYVKCLDRIGNAVADGEVIGISEPLKDRTYVVNVVVPKELIDNIRAIKVA